MIPAIILANKHHIKHAVHEYFHDHSVQSYGLEFAEKLGVTQHEIFKSLVLKFDNNTLLNAIIPVDSMFKLKSIAKIFSAKKSLYGVSNGSRALNGVCIRWCEFIGSKKRSLTIIDLSAQITCKWQKKITEFKKLKFHISEKLKMLVQ